MALENTPDNLDFLSQLNFRMQVKKLPNVSFFVVRCNIPGISSNPVEQPNPFTVIPHAGDHITFNEFIPTWKVDEDLKNFLEIHNWIYGLGFPEDFSQYKALSDLRQEMGMGLKSDVILTILSANHTVNYEVVYKDAFPVLLSDLAFNTQDATVQYLEATASFRYTSYTITRIP